MDIKYSVVLNESKKATAIANYVIANQNENGKYITRNFLEKYNSLGVYALDYCGCIGGITFHIENEWLFIDYGCIFEGYRYEHIYSNLFYRILDYAKFKKLNGIFVSTYDFECPEIYEHFGFTKGSVMHNCPTGNTNIDYYMEIKHDSK